MKYVIFGPTGKIQDTIYIPSSKSISNRMLIINSLAGSVQQIDNLSESDDTRLLLKALQEGNDLKDVGHAGTAMRFLTALLATRSHKVILTGSPRMKQRPIGPLVEALRELGAKINYLETKGCPPLEISGKGIHGGSIEVEGGISSQFISALMMIGPVLSGGLQISLRGEVVSSTYIRMTLELMKQCGVDATFEDNQIVVPRKPYEVSRLSVEADWSGASYWYQVAVLKPGSRIHLPNLFKESLQGDSVVASLFEGLGVKSEFNQKGVTLISGDVVLPERFNNDFTGCPDLVQTFAVTLCALGIPYTFTGTQTLRVKETDRIHALEVELKKVGYLLHSDPTGNWITWDGRRCDPEAVPVIKTYHDHRMAMAFAPLAIKLGRIGIEDPRVVSKSYPGYWKDLEKAGFNSPFCSINSEGSCD